ncbi:DUF2255 family protein [Streptomyces sp. NPDC053750]|uniref:DUF2255 family protein n=1 Tax=Streptomyces sp. NPDC053750 TaxID=3365714 RepID=UPI0037D633B9
MYVRAYPGLRSRWYRAAREHGHGRIRVDGRTRKAVHTTRDPDVPAGLDAAIHASTDRWPTR